MYSLSVANIFYSVLFLSCIYLTRIIFNRKPFPLNSPPLIQDENNVPYLGSMNFFNKRWEFFEESARKSESGNFSFRLANLRVIGLTGLKGREYCKFTVLLKKRSRFFSSMLLIKFDEQSSIQRIVSKLVTQSYLEESKMKLILT